MMMVIHAGNTLAEYAQVYPVVALRRPPACPGCRVAGRMTSLGRYPRRKPLEGRAEVPEPVWVRRWRCGACGKSTSLLPDLFHRYRQYTWAIIGAALIRRLILKQTWAQVQAALSQMPVEVAPAPSIDSLRRWCQAYARQARAWLHAALVVLATVRPDLAFLNAPGSVAGAPAQQLWPVLAALAGWLEPAHGAAAAPTVAEVRVAWRWGWNQGVGRLV
jgi:hypothetical protein